MGLIVVTLDTVRAFSHVIIIASALFDDAYVYLEVRTVIIL